MDNLAQALATFSSVGKRYWRAKLLWNLGYLALMLAFFLIPFAQEYTIFAQDALRGAWGAFLGTFFGNEAIIPVLEPVLALGWAFIIVLPDWRRHANARMFRAAVLQGADLSTPATPEQQATLYAGELVALPATFGPLQDVLAQQRRGLFGWAIGCPLLGLAFAGFVPGALWLIHAPIPKDIFHDVPFSLILEIGVIEALALGLLCAPLWLAPWARRLGRPLWFEADEIGLRPRGVARDSPQAIRWIDIKAFSLITKMPALVFTGARIGRYRAKTQPYPQLFLDTGATLLTWMPGPNPTAEALAAHNSLLRTIITRMGSEPRDLTAAADMTDLLARTSHPEKIGLKNWPTLRGVIVPMAYGNRRQIRWFGAFLIVSFVTPFLPYVVAGVAAIIQASIR